MPAQIQLINNSGTVLIDDTYSNMSVLAKGTQANPPASVAGTVIAYRRTSTDGATYQWWRFGAPTSSGSYGMQLSNSAGQLVFDALRQYARVVSTVDGPIYGQPNVVVPVPAGRTYAVITSKRSVYFEREVRSAGANLWEYRVRARQTIAVVSSSSVTLQWTAPAWGQWSNPTAFVPPERSPDYQSRFLILDVTGY